MDALPNLLTESVVGIWLIHVSSGHGHSKHIVSGSCASAVVGNGARSTPPAGLWNGVYFYFAEGVLHPRGTTERLGFQTPAQSAPNLLKHA